MAGHSKYLQAPEDHSGDGGMVLTWGQVLFLLFWVGACGVHWWSQGTPPTGWAPMLYLVPAGLVGAGFDFLVGRALGLKNHIRID